MNDHARADPATPPALHGRDAEVTLIDERLAAVCGGRGGVLLVDGAPGMGKTRLLDEVRSRADRAGLRVLHAAATRFQPETPFAALLTATLSAEPPIVDMRSVRDLSSRHTMGYWLLHDLRQALAEQAARTPLVIVLDDLQWADAGTVGAIRLLAAELGRDAVLWVLAGRRGQAGPLVRDLFSHLSGTGATVLRLAPLSPSAVAGLVEDIAGPAATPRLLDLVAAADGHPLWLIELLRDPHQNGCLRIAVESLAPLTPGTRQMIRIAAVLPARFTTEQLATVLGTHPVELIEPLDEAVQAGLLSIDGAGIRFCPGLLRRATREALPGWVRRTLENAAAEVAADPAPAPVQPATRRPSTGLASLTTAELNVARLVASGVTNRDAARQLSLSPHTVNAHIRHTFTKLGIRSRVQLANMLHEVGAAH